MSSNKHEDNEPFELKRKIIRHDPEWLSFLWIAQIATIAAFIYGLVFTTHR